MLRFQNKQTKKTKKGNQMDENQKKSLELAIKRIDKAFAKGTLIRLRDK